MSDVVPSFFPTPHEIAGGLRWVREHPMVATAAAAAATAVSVITFLRASTLINDDDETIDSDGNVTTAIDTAPFADLDALPESRERFATWSDHYPRGPASHLHNVHNDGATHLAHKKSLSHQDFTPHTLRKDAEDVYSNTDSDVSSVSRMLSRRNSPASSSRLCDDTESSEDSPRGVDVPPTCIEGECYDPEDDPNSASPQWGWYVSTTPPDEQYT